MKSVVDIPDNISTPDQRCFNVADQRWNNFDPTLKMKQKPTSDFQRCTTLIQHQFPTLKQRRFSFISTSKSYIEINRGGDKDGFVNR